MHVDASKILLHLLRFGDKSLYSLKLISLKRPLKAAVGSDSTFQLGV